MNVMLLLENYPALRQLLEAIGLSVFHTLWAGGLLLLLLVVMLKVIPTQRAKARFAAALLTLQLLFLLFLAVFFYQWNQAAPPDYVVGTITAPVSTTTMVLPSASSTVEITAPSAEIDWLTLLQQWSPWWAALWLLGGLYHAIQLLLGLRHTRRLRANAQAVSCDWKQQFDRLKQHLGISRSVMFRTSAQTAVPFTFGWLKPVVLIPAGLLTQLSPEQVEMIVLHELAHIRRHDYLWSLSQSVAEVVLFYHPAYWYIARVLEREREFACDQMTVSITQQPEIYARTLLQLASTVVPTYGLAASGKRGLSDRIKRIVSPTNRQKNASVLPVMVLVGVLGLASVTFALQLQPPGSSNTREAQEQLADSTGRDYGPSFEEVMAQVPDETLDTTSLTLDEIYGNALTIDQSLNQFARSMKEYVASHPEAYENQPTGSPVNYSSPEVLYVVDGQVKNPKAIRRSEVEEISVYRDLEKLTLEGIDLRGYSVVVAASTTGSRIHSQDSTRSGQQLYLRNGWGQITPPASPDKPRNTANPTNQWLYIVNDQIQTNRPAFLEQYYQTAGWETRIVPAAGWWIDDYLTEEQRNSVKDLYRYTGILFITHRDYQPRHVVYGTVVKREYGYLVPDVTVRVKGKNVSTTTNAYGNYRLNTHRLDTIEFLFDGDVIEEVPVAGRRQINLTAPVDRARIEKMKSEKMQKVVHRIEQKLQAKNKRNDENSIAEASQTQPAQDSIIANALLVVDGVPQHDRTWTDWYLSINQDIQSAEVLMRTDGVYQYYRTPPNFVKDADGFEVRKAAIPEAISKEQQKAWLVEGYKKVVLVETTRGSADTKTANPSGEEPPAKPAQDSTTKNTLVIVDGVPQYNKTLVEVDQALKQNPSYAHYTLTSYGVDSSQVILRTLRATEYDRVVRIDSWASLKKDGIIAPNRLESLLQVFPNPTYDWFTLQFFIGEDLPVIISILNNQGQPLTTLADQTYPAGSHEVGWDASNQKPGVYFVQWTAGEQRVTRQVVIE